MTNPVYNFDTIPARAGTGTVKFDLREELFGRPDVIPMWVADMDFECAPQIREAILERAAHNVYGYDIGGERCRESLASWVERRNGWKVDGEWMRFTTGVVAGLGFAIRAFTDPGDAIVIQTPVYPPFRGMTEANGRRVVTNPLRRTDTGFEIDFDNLEKIFAGSPEAVCRRSGADFAPLSRQTRAIILCNPHNPVGRVFTREELTRLGELCEKHDVTIISDEIHSDLVFAPHRHVHIASLDPRFATRTITFVAPSKTFNIAGLATSAAIISDAAMREKWDAEYARAHIIDGTMFGHTALRAAYDECEGWLDQLLPYIKSNIDYVREFLASRVPQIKTSPQQGTYLMWLDFRELGFASQKELMEWLAREAGLGLNSGADFGREGVGFARLNAATNRATIEKALEQLAEAVTSLRRI